MPAIPAGQLQKGNQVVQHDSTIKIVTEVKDVIPTCLAETIVTYSDGTWERFCNHKNITVLVEVLKRVPKT